MSISARRNLLTADSRKWAYAQDGFGSGPRNPRGCAIPYPIGLPVLSCQFDCQHHGEWCQRATD